MHDRTNRPLEPNLADIFAHLNALFDAAFVHPHPHSWIEIAYGHPDIRNGAVDQAQNYSPFKLKEPAEFAAAKNQAGFNIYLGVALRQGKQPRNGRANTNHYLSRKRAAAG